jgi:hypothetical protein
MIGKTKPFAAVPRKAFGGGSRMRKLKKKRRRESHNEADRAPVPGAAIDRPFPPVFVPCRGTVAGAMSLSYGRELLYFDESPSIEMQVRAILENR